MRRLKQPAPPRHGESEYFQLVAAAERCVRMALDCEKMPPVNPAPILDWLHSKSESSQE
jgi:hypothetical protein